MKIIALTIALLFGVPAFSESENDLIGSWQYDGFIYQGHRYPKPDTELTLIFTFNPDHTHLLFWKRSDESGFCERKGTWEVQGQTLEMSVTWLNPQNDPSCGADPDMQMKTSETQFSVQADQLNFPFLAEWPTVHLHSQTLAISSHAPVGAGQCVSSFGKLSLFISGLTWHQARNRAKHGHNSDCKREVGGLLIFRHRRISPEVCFEPGSNEGLLLRWRNPMWQMHS